MVNNCGLGLGLRDYEAGLDGWSIFRHKPRVSGSPGRGVHPPIAR